MPCGCMSELGLPEDVRDVKPVERALTAERRWLSRSTRHPALKQERRFARTARPGSRTLGIPVL
ncbi:hypothetical protein Atep_31020 (plasmid) [Allochromatium tepidum]|uniref:Uncharacterized protein n=1 Tax=Allochromatium tepidum TaxID=553982 RepID=A0ABM7QQV1_9GAMM|nr:hypothetical protein Atep_31020 [Allochromatium tepidum]